MKMICFLDTILVEKMRIKRYIFNYINYI